MHMCVYTYERDRQTDKQIDGERVYVVLSLHLHCHTSYSCWLSIWNILWEIC